MGGCTTRGLLEGEIITRDGRFKLGWLLSVHEADVG